MIGQNISHYKILEKLGEGGMGVVYKAEDSKLKRDVAIKFLPRQIAASEEERERFKIEAQAAAALNHPNIATIHSIEEYDDELFIVMEYIKGRELRQLIIDNGQLTIINCLDLAAQIASGLQAAHKKGIVHRDIKSANVMVTESGLVKIMDFGLAKMRGKVQMTKIGTTLGTAAYMSPEQARGEEVDHRTDIWAFGVVLYEMLTGQFPFRGDYEQAVIYAILNQEPEGLSSLRPDVPDFLQQVVVKTLAKHIEERYQEMAVVLQDLRNDEATKPDVSGTAVGWSQKKKQNNRQNRTVLLSVLAAILIIAVAVVFWKRDKGTPNSKVKRIAVLPLENLGPAEQEYFADGITGEITSKLSGLSGLEVIARSSAMQYKNTTKSLQKIGKELNVDYVLEGTIQWGESQQGTKRIRVNPELIKIAGAIQVWSRPYEADFFNAFQLQTDIAAKVAEALDVTLVKAEQQALQSKLTTNSEAYDIYLRAKEYSIFSTDERKLKIGEQMFSEAISLDNNFAAAYAELSTIQSSLYWFFYDRSKEKLSQSTANAQKALLLNPNLPAAHVAMGNYYYHGKLDYEPALKEYEEAIRLQPNNADAYAGIGFVLRRQGKIQEALAPIKKSLELDPRNLDYPLQIALTYLLLREYNQANQFFDRVIAFAPEDGMPFYYKARSKLLSNGDTIEAREIVQNALLRKIVVDDPHLKYVLSICDVLEENPSDALKYLADIQNMDDQFMYKPKKLLIAEIHKLMNNEPLARKNYQAARQLLEKEIKNHPEDSRLYSSLGIAYAGLGQKADAIRAGKRGVELLPVSKEAWRGSFRVLDLAQIYTMFGEPDLAMDLLDELLASPTDAISTALLKIDPLWAPLRQHPRFQQLLKKYSTGETR